MAHGICVTLIAKESIDIVHSSGVSYNKASL